MKDEKGIMSQLLGNLGVFTKDEALAATLMYAGFNLISVEEMDTKDDLRDSVFTFAREKGIQDLIDSYNSGTVKVNANIFYHIAKDIITRPTRNNYPTKK